MDHYSNGKKITALEALLQKSLFASRWLLAPVFLGLGLALIAVLLYFYIEAYHLIIYVFTTTKKSPDFIPKVLALVDMALVGGLIITVMLSSYENFVSKSEHAKFSWLSRMDASLLKIKVAISIVAISGIHLLQKFMDTEHIDNTKMILYIAVHLTFVISACCMGWLDRKLKN